MIEDKELRDLFKIESEEHLQRLEAGLLTLEKEPANRELLDNVFREVHSLKGAARMVCLTDIEAISHRIEDILGNAKKGETRLTTHSIGCIYRSLDAVRKLAHEAVTGEPAFVDTSALLAQLQLPEKPVIKAGMSIDASISDFGIPVSDLKSKRSTPQSKIKNQKSKLSASQSKIQNPKSKIEKPVSEDKDSTPGAPPPEFKIDTVRVGTKALDVLMTQLGELSVIKNRVARRISEIEEIIGLWEEIRKSNADHGVRNAELKTKATHSTDIDSALRTPHSTFELLGVLLNSLMNATNEDYSKFDYVAGELESGIRTIRLLPMSTIFNLFPRTVRDTAREQSKEVNLVIEGGETTADKRIIEEMKDPLMHLIRNAIDHGIELPAVREQKNKPPAGTIKLRAYQTPTNIVIAVTDDGQGLDMNAIKRTALKQKICREEELAAMTPAQIQSLVLISGFSTSSFVTDVSGRGVGLDVVRANVERLKGTIRIESEPGAGCTFRVQLPITLATARVLLVTVNGIKYAVPVEYVLTTSLVAMHEIFPVEGRDTILFDNQPVSVAKLSELLELKIPQSAIGNPQSTFRNPQSNTPCIILSAGEEKLGILVDELLGEQEIVLKPQSMILKRVRNVYGATILDTGEVCMIVNPQDLIKSLRKLEVPPIEEKPMKDAEKKKSILFAEDSITTRTQIKRILEGAGYEVIPAVDGLDAFNKLNTRSFDALVTDILMPNMDGLTLTAKVRQDKKHRELPIILVTSLASDEDKKKGLEAGANAYITKPAFDQKMLLDTLKKLI